MQNIILFSLLFLMNLSAQTDTVLSDIYKWKEISSGEEKAELLKGNTTDINDFVIYASSINSDNSFKEKNDKETLIIVKEGELKIAVKNDEKILSPGSIAYIIPDEEFQIKNSGKKDAVFYTFLYEAKNSNKKPDEYNSFLIDWNDLEFKPHDKGGIRQYFEKPTRMFKRFEMHVTTLNAGIKSHEPHTHRAEEIVLMIDGNAEMQIEVEFKNASKGDIIFLGANVPHAIKNIDDKPITYFAFQWE